MAAASRIAAIAALGLAAACASPRPVDIAEAPRASPGKAPIALERQVRYYVDEQGRVWDDRGRKLERFIDPQPAPLQ